MESSSLFNLASCYFICSAKSVILCCSTPCSVSWRPPFSTLSTSIIKIGWLLGFLLWLPFSREVICMSRLGYQRLVSWLSYIWLFHFWVWFSGSSYFGPMLSLVINGFSILIHVVCLIGLYIDEKFLIFKVLLLPLYQTFLSLFDHNDRHSEFVDSIRQSVDDMTTGLLSSTDFKNKSVQQLNEMLASRMRKLCTNVTTSWYKSCPVLFARSCTAYVNQTQLPN